MLALAMTASLVLSGCGGGGTTTEEKPAEGGNTTEQSGQWYLARHSDSPLCYLPTGFYLLIVGIASMRTITDDTFSVRAAVLLIGALVLLLAVSAIAKLLRRRDMPASRPSADSVRPAAS